MNRTKKIGLGVAGIAVTALLAMSVKDIEQGTTQPIMEEPVVNSQDTVADEPTAYGIPLSGFIVHQDKVKSGSTLSDLLAPYGIGPDQALALAVNSKDVFDIRKIRTGQPYAMVMDVDSVPAFFVYEVDAIEHVVFHLRDSLPAERRMHEVRIYERTAEIEVTSSLYEAVVNAGADRMLALKLSEVFAWTVDFYRIQKGDRFLVLYEERFVAHEPIGVGEILAVQYQSGDHHLEGYRFEHDGKVDHYDADGNSLRKAFLKAPLKFSRISSGFSNRRFHPVQRRWKSHKGTDYAAPRGTPILAVGDGVVEKAGYTGGNGNYVKIRHNGTYSTQYLHMSKKLVKNGQHVTQGQSIGLVGSTGLATGPHVCFRFWKNGVQVDHRREEFPSAEPLLPELRPGFNAQRSEYERKLQEGVVAFF